MTSPARARRSGCSAEAEAAIRKEVVRRVQMRFMGRGNVGMVGVLQGCGELVPQADGRWNGLMVTCLRSGVRSDSTFITARNFLFQPFRSLATLGLGKEGVQ